MIRFYNIILILLLSFHAKDPCSCYGVRDVRKGIPKEFNRSNDVFIGDVISVHDNNYVYKIEVRQVFKGNLKVGQTIKGVNVDCPPFITDIDVDERWIFFGQQYSNTFKTNDCGLSSSFSDPFGISRLLSNQPLNTPGEMQSEETLKDIKEKIDLKILEQEIINVLGELAKSD